MSTPRLALVSVLLPLLAAFAAGPHPAHSRAPDDLAELESAFYRASQLDDAARRTAALEALVATGNPEASAALVGEFARAFRELSEAREKAARLRSDLERRAVILANLESAAERNPGLKDKIPDLRKQLGELEETLRKRVERAQRYQPWCRELTGGLERLLAGLSPLKRGKVEKRLGDDAEENPTFAVRVGSLELLGRLGSQGTAARIGKLLEAWSDEKLKAEKKIPKLMGEVRKMERRMQEEAERTGGGGMQDTRFLYDKAKREAAGLRRLSHELTELIDVAVRSGGLALAREGPEARAKTLPPLARSVRKHKDRTRLHLLSMVAAAGREAVGGWLRDLLLEEREPLARAEMIDALASMGDTELLDPLLERFLSDENAHVRSRSVAALAFLRDARAIPALIERLEADEGRLRTDIGQALASLTGRDFHGNVALWRKWWSDEGEGFVVPEAPEKKTPLEEAQESRGVTFFGITTESQKVLFVLDVSGSMNFTNAPRGGTTERPDDPDVFPKGSELSRLEVAKRDLVRALGGLRDGGLFNLVLYASDVWSWEDELVEMETDTRVEVVEFIDRLDAVGGTNIYGAMERALEVAGVEDSAGGTWSKPDIDTIYLLTDGRATVGLTTDADQILSFVRERNRTAGIVIHTIGLSEAHDAYLLRRLAEDNGGVYVGR